MMPFKKYSGKQKYGHRNRQVGIGKVLHINYREITWENLGGNETLL